MKKILRNPTRAVKIGAIYIGNGNPIAVQTMTSTHTSNVGATLEQIKVLEKAGADIIRIAVDSIRDSEALIQIRESTKANLSVDLQENYRLIERVAPYVNKVRYNPGHLWHHEREKSWQDKVKFIVDNAVKYDCALRVGINCGSIDNEIAKKFPSDSIEPMLESAFIHCQLLDSLGFFRYCVSLKDSNPYKVIKLNTRFAEQRPEIPLHLGVTEAGLAEEGIVKTRVALEQLISRGIGDTIRVSLTLPSTEKGEEIRAGKEIIEDVYEDRIRGIVDYGSKGLNLISCPSCSRVENEAFVELARKVEETTRYAKSYKITIATMGCRVNGPGESDRADLGLWCGAKLVNLKREGVLIGSYSYDKILSKMKEELDKIIEEKKMNKHFYTRSS